MEMELSIVDDGHDDYLILNGWWSATADIYSTTSPRIWWRSPVAAPFVRFRMAQNCWMETAGSTVDGRYWYILLPCFCLGILSLIRPSRFRSRISKLRSFFSRPGTIQSFDSERRHRESTPKHWTFIFASDQPENMRFFRPWFPRKKDIVSAVELTGAGNSVSWENFPTV